MQVIGHRGAMGSAPENSLNAFKAAMASGADWVELDIRLSKDGVAVVIHDDTLERLANDKRMIAETVWPDLSKIPLVSGARLATLEHVLSATAGKINLNIELKTVDAASAVVAEIQSRKLDPKGLLVSSFSWRALDQVHLLDKNIPTAKIRRWWPLVTTKQIKKYGLSAVCLRHNWLASFVINRLHLKGLRVYAYTIDDAPTILRAKRLGLWGIVTNTPSETSEILQKDVVQ